METYLIGGVQTTLGNVSHEFTEKVRGVLEGEERGSHVAGTAVANHGLKVMPAEFKACQKLQPSYAGLAWFK